MESIIPGNKKGKCFICSTQGYTESHHIFGGCDRNNSEAFGLKVDLCVEHHRGTRGAHGKDGKGIQNYLHQTGQEVFEETHSRDEFRAHFRKSYL